MEIALSKKKAACTQETGKEDAENTENQSPDLARLLGTMVAAHPAIHQLHMPGKGEVTSSEKGPELRIGGGSHSRDEGGTPMVGGGVTSPQWSTITDHSIRPDYRVELHR